MENPSDVQAILALIDLKAREIVEELVFGYEPNPHPEGLVILLQDVPERTDVER